MKQYPITTHQIESNAKRWILILSLLLVLVTCGILIYKLVSKPNGSSSVTQAGACVGAGGVFDYQYNECKNLSEDKCRSIGGRFVECASPCRHLPKATACIEMCEQYCQL